jgi:hypothetical protein
MRSEALKDFIREHAVLFWYSPDDKTETVSDELLVEVKQEEVKQFLIDISMTI